MRTKHLSRCGAHESHFSTQTTVSLLPTPQPPASFLWVDVEEELLSHNVDVALVLLIRTLLVLSPSGLTGFHPLNNTRTFCSSTHLPTSVSAVPFHLSALERAVCLTVVFLRVSLSCGYLRIILSSHRMRKGSPLPKLLQVCNPNCNNFYLIFFSACEFFLAHDFLGQGGGLS